MDNHSILLFLILLFITSCSTPSEKPNNQTSTEQQLTGKYCYSYVTAMDTVSLEVNIVNKQVTGTLTYSLHEKDRNMGTVTGMIRDSILILYYTFMSEGIQSVRQVVFRNKENQMVEGFGESYMKNDTLYLKNIDSLSFNTSLTMKASGCP